MKTRGWSWSRLIGRVFPSKREDPSPQDNRQPVKVPILPSSEAKGGAGQIDSVKFACPEPTRRWGFAHIVLRQACQSSSVEFLWALTTEERRDYLQHSQELADAVPATPGDLAFRPEEIRPERLLLGKRPGVILEFPEPTCRGEVFSRGVVLNCELKRLTPDDNPDFRYFTLEKGSQEGMAFLCERTDEGHPNYGPVGILQRHQFAEAILTVLVRDSAFGRG